MNNSFTQKHSFCATTLRSPLCWVLGDIRKYAIPLLSLGGSSFNKGRQVSFKLCCNLCFHLKLQYIINFIVNKWYFLVNLNLAVPIGNHCSHFSIINYNEDFITPHLYTFLFIYNRFLERKLLSQRV